MGMWQHCNDIWSFFNVHTARESDTLPFFYFLVRFSLFFSEVIWCSMHQGCPECWCNTRYVSLLLLISPLVPLALFPLLHKATAMTYVTSYDIKCVTAWCNILRIWIEFGSRVNTVNMVTGLGRDCRGIGVRAPLGTRYSPCLGRFWVPSSLIFNWHWGGGGALSRF
jgi:hypothetical protein